MTERKNYNERTYTGRRFTEDARAITANKQAKARKQRIIITSTVLALVAVIAAGFMVFGAMKAPKLATPAPTTAVVTTNAAPKLAAVQQTPTRQSAAQTNEQQNVQSTPVQQTVQQTTPQAVQQDTQQTAQQTTPQTQQATQPSQDRIDNINGERVYIDTKRQAPANSGTPAHYYAYGKTSYGFDWTYKADNGNFLLRCDYNFNQQQYDFQFYGVTPGVSHVTLYYNTADNVQVPVNLTVTVDDALNVTAG